MKYFYSLLLTPVLFLVGAMATQAASFDITSSVSLASTVYHMVHAEIDGQDYLLVAAGEDGVLIYAITSSGISSTPTATISTTGTARDIVVSGNMLYIADSNAGSGLNIRGHVYFYSIANPSSPTLIYDYSNSFGNYETVEISDSGTLLFAGDKLNGVRVVDVSNPATPSTLSTYADGAASVDLVAVGTKLYIAQSVAEAMVGYLYVMDFSDPSAPAALGGGSISYNTSEIAVDGSIVYTASGAEGLKIYDYSNPSNPALLGTYDSEGSVNGFAAVSDSVGVIADGSSGVDMISFSNAALPQMVAASSSDQTQLNSAVDVVAFDNRLFILSAGLYEIELEYSFTVQGTGSGKDGRIIVSESDDLWCTISVDENGAGAQAYLADMNGDGAALEIVSAPVDKVKKPKLRVYDAFGCAELSKKSLTDADQKQAFTIGVANYYTNNNQSEIIATRVFEKDNVNKLTIVAYFVKTDNKISKKASVTENPTAKQFVKEGIKIKFKADKAYPIIIQAKETTDTKVKYQLKKKSDGSFVLKKKAE